MAKKPYNGHESWTAWNVSLWINNDEGLYRRALELAQRHGIARHLHPSRHYLRQRRARYMGDHGADARQPGGVTMPRPQLDDALGAVALFALLFLFLNVTPA